MIYLRKLYNPSKYNNYQSGEIPEFGVGDNEIWLAFRKD